MEGEREARVSEREESKIPPPPPSSQDNRVILWDIRKANGPLMTLDQHNGARASNDPSGSQSPSYYIKQLTYICIIQYIIFTGIYHKSSALVA